MKKIVFFLLLILVLYSLIIDITGYSFVGFWADVIFAISISITIILLLIFYWKSNSKFQLFIKLLSIIFCSIVIIFSIIAINLNSNYISFYHKNIKNNNFRIHYFEPNDVWELENGFISIHQISKKVPFLEITFFNGLPSSEFYNEEFEDKNKSEQKKIIEAFIIYTLNQNKY
ncbi:MAG: hypothetical protein AB8B78_05445 [Polaribacter sp.]